MRRAVGATGTRRPIASYLKDHGEGPHHVCFLAPDVDDALEALGDKDANVFLGGKGRRACFLSGRLSGVLVELVNGRPLRKARDATLKSLVVNLPCTGIALDSLCQKEVVAAEVPYVGSEACLGHAGSLLTATTACGGIK